MDIVYHRAPNRTQSDILLVMLPGVGFAPDDFLSHGFVRAVQERGLAVDVAVASPGLDAYLDQTLAANLRREIGRCRPDEHARVWFLGISLGGMGALLYAQAYAASVEGIALIAPFLGTAGLVAEVVRMGGLSSWQPGEVAPNDSERLLLGWLKAFTAVPRPRPKLYLGYARDDRFAQGHAMLADRLPRSHVLVTEGGHDWATWTRLWQKILDREPFSAPV